jgi:hypothetical protein
MHVTIDDCLGRGKCSIDGEILWVLTPECDPVNRFGIMCLAAHCYIHADGIQEGPIVACTDAELQASLDEAYP